MKLTAEEIARATEGSWSPHVSPDTTFEFVSTDTRAISPGALFVALRGENFDGKEFRFNDLELVLDKTEYKPEDRVRLLINTDLNDGTVYLFVRPVSGIYRLPEVIKLDGKTAVRSIDPASSP